MTYALSNTSSQSLSKSQVLWRQDEKGRWWYCHPNQRCVKWSLAGFVAGIDSTPPDHAKRLELAEGLFVPDIMLAFTKAK